MNSFPGIIIGYMVLYGLKSEVFWRKLPLESLMGLFLKMNGNMIENEEK